MKVEPFRRTGLLAALFFIFTACQAHFVLAQTSALTTSPVPLTADAKEAINKGILAAEQQDYLQAIRYFQDARKIAPDAPEIYFDLGLAESKIPGRELRAIAWFGAYLAAKPNAANAPAVKDQIDALDVKSHSDVSRLIKSIQDQDFPAGEPPSFIGRSEYIAMMKAMDLSVVAELWAAAGDFAAALKVANVIQDTKKTRARDGALEAIATAQAQAGEIAASQKTADRIREGDHGKSDAQAAIAEAQVKAGEITDAKITLAVALKNASQIPKTGQAEKGLVLTRIAVVQIKAGDIIGARNTLTAALKNVDEIPSGYLSEHYKMNTQVSVANALVRAGDIAGARNALAAALKSADQIKDADQRNNEKKYITEVYVTAVSTNTLASAIQPTVPIIAAADWLNKLADTAALNSDPFLDLAGYLRALQPYEYKRELFAAVGAIARTQTLIDGMLKQQAKQLGGR